MKLQQNYKQAPCAFISKAGLTAAGSPAGQEMTSPSKVPSVPAASFRIAVPFRGQLLNGEKSPLFFAFSPGRRVLGILRTGFGSLQILKEP